MPFDELARQDAWEGRICLGKSHKGDAPDNIMITLDGGLAFAMQRYLEGQISKGGDYCTVRLLVILAEALRIGVAQARDQERNKDRTEP